MTDTKGAGFKAAPFFVAACLLAVIHLSVMPAMAEVPVVDIESRESVTPVKATATSAPPTASATAAVPGGNRQNQLSEIFMQMQQLQREVQELRGLVEQQTFDIQALQQQVKDNYIDVDKRISTLQSSVTAPVSAAVAGEAVSSRADEQPSSGAEKDSYDAAYKLLDQGRKDDAVLAFKKHVALYPDGKYTPNAYYWMGQIYVSQSQLDAAREQFATLLKNFPDDRKAPDAKFALGKVYFQQGKKPEAKKLIQEVAQGDSRAAALAKTFLQDNF